MTVLKPCPFCGGTARFFKGGFLEGGFEWVECECCGVGMSGKNPIEKWNTRKEAVK